MTGIRSIADIRLRHGPGGHGEKVSRETFSVPAPKREARDDWKSHEINVLVAMRRQSAAETARCLPGRTARAVYVKRHRLGLAAPNSRSRRKG